jgi:hypothetical protein
MRKVALPWAIFMSLRKSVVLLRSCASLSLALALPCANGHEKNGPSMGQFHVTT